jgi:hypothetical protein
LYDIINQQQSAHEAAVKEAAITQKYSSIDSLKRSDKITALKDTKLDPYKLSNPYDGLANSLHRWKTVANDAILSNYTEEQKTAIASHYYDKMIGPMYGGMHIESMSKELWLKEAYKEAVNYNIEDSYNNSITHSLSHGWNEGLPDLARAGQFVYNMLGSGLDSVVKLYQQRKEELTRPWFGEAQNAHNQVSGVDHSKLDDLVNKGTQYQTETHEFWAAALPNYDGWLNHATSFVAEQAAQLPMYIAMGEGSGLAKGSNLTTSLFTSAAGKRVFGYLMAGSEGLAYGVATRKQEDKSQAWKDAVGYTVFHGLFDIGGGITKKLGDVVSGAAKDALDRRAERLSLALDGKRPATDVERYEDHKTEVGNNLVVAGIPGQRAIFAEALAHVADMENRGWDRATIKDHELRLMNADPARFTPVFSSAAYVRSLLSVIGKRLTQIEPGSENEKFLSTRLAQLIIDAGSSLNTHVKGVQEQASEVVAAEAGTPGAKRTLDFYKAKVVAELAKDPTAAKMVKPEQIEKMAQQKMTEAQIKAAARAEKELVRNPVKEATSIALREKPVAIPKMRVRSERTVDRFGQPAVRYSVNPDYKVRLEKYISKLKKYISDAKIQGKSLTQFFKDMSDEDFKDDLSTHFYPKALKDANIYFEGQQTIEGKQNPNFLAFMYNYIGQMPREFGKELEKRLIGTMKVQAYLKGLRPTEPQLRYYAKAMYNHVGNFLGSGRWPKEANLFRSTQEDIFHSTIWQEELLDEKHTQELKNIEGMFSGNPAAKRAALTAHNVLSEKRMAEYAKGPKDMTSQDKVKEHDDAIADLITSLGDYERWQF